MTPKTWGLSAPMGAKIVLIAAICTLGLAQRSEANAAFYTDLWLADYFDGDSVPTFGMGVLEADYGEYYDVSSTSYQYGPNDDWVGCLDEDEYYAEADTTLNDTYYIFGVEDGSYEWEEDSDFTGEGDYGPVDLGSDGQLLPIDPFNTNYDFVSGTPGSGYSYALAADSGGLFCSYAGFTWSRFEPGGMAYSGVHARGLGIEACVGVCDSTLRRLGAWGPSGTADIHIKSCEHM